MCSKLKTCQCIGLFHKFIRSTKVSSFLKCFFKFKKNVYFMCMCLCVMKVRRGCLSQYSPWSYRCL